jgi:protein-tyrosine-phosphatase
LTDRYGRNRILFVCTANICRSPTAELLARGRFGEEVSVFRSAGFLDPDHLVPPELVRVLGDRGIDATNHRSYRIDEASIEAAELILVMESSHLQKVTGLRPEALAKTVPLKEAAEIMTAQPPGPVSVGALLADVNRDRDPRRYLGSQWDVADPYGRRMKAYRQAVEEIDQLVALVIGRLNQPTSGAPGAEPPPARSR